MLFLAFGSGLIGFLDDFIKVIRHRNLGLTEAQKMILQIFRKYAVDRIVGKNIEVAVLLTLLPLLIVDVPVDLVVTCGAFTSGFPCGSITAELLYPAESVCVRRFQTLRRACLFCQISYNF